MAILSFVIILVYLMVTQHQKIPGIPGLTALGCVLVAFAGLIWLILYPVSGLSRSESHRTGNPSGR